MRGSKKERLERSGWRVGTTAEFLELSPEEEAMIELKVALSEFLRELRRKHKWTQTLVAKKLGSSQSRVAKMEAADPSVSIDLLVRALLALGATRRDVGHAIADRVA